jgi:hypothetical protein
MQLHEFRHIVSTIDDLLSMSEPPSSIVISTDYLHIDSEEDDSDENNPVFMRLTFSLKNGTSEIKIQDNAGVFSYINFKGENLKSIEFNSNYITSTDSSFKKALKQIRAFDRQHNNASNVINTPIDRASFGLAEVS